jgi:hypothetical protein
VISGHPFILDDELGWKLAPSKATTHHSRYFDTRYTTNSFGFRDKPRSTAKSDDAYRIWLYGGSVIFGWGLNDGERQISLKTRGLVWKYGILVSLDGA